LGGAPSTSAPAGRAGGGDEASIKAADYLTPPVARAGRSAVGPKKYRGQRFEGMLLGGYLQLLLHSPIAGVRYLTSRGCSWSLSIARLSRWWGSLPAAHSHGSGPTVRAILRPPRRRVPNDGFLVRPELAAQDNLLIACLVFEPRRPATAALCFIEARQVYMMLVLLPIGERLTVTTKTVRRAGCPWG